MRISRAHLGRVGVVAGTALLGVGLLGGTAQAASYPYDGQSPEATSCASDATTMESAQVVTSGGVNVGVIELRYSLSCHAGWARLTLNASQGACGTASAGYDCSQAILTRDNDGEQETCSITQGQTQCYTDMLYDLGMSQFAQAYVDTASGVASTRTVSY